VIEVKTQAQLDKAMERADVRDGEELVVIVGNGHFVVSEGTPYFQTWGQSSPRMESWGQSSPRMESREQSSPRMESWEQSSPTMVSRGQSSPTMVSRGQSSPTMVSWEQSSPTMVSRGQSSVSGRIGSYSQPRFWRHERSTIEIPGAVVLDPPKISTAGEWLEYWGVEVSDGIAVLFKAVGGDWVSSRGFTYEPGTEPACEDWNPDPTISCGQGLHFCPAPSVALGYRGDAKKFVACPIALKDMVVSEAGSVPDKVRAPRVAAPVWEVDVNGDPIKAEAEQS
jgi:hypothetical protein